MNTEILYEDADVLVCRKPAGFPTQTASLGKADMVSELKKYLADKYQEKNPYLGIVHRLDQPVEGLLVFAKNKKAAAKMTNDLKQGLYNKNYYAVAFNQPLIEQGMLQDYILRDSHTQTAKIVTADVVGAQKAVLHYRIVTAVKGCVLYAIHIDTGRFHQIRVQMAHAGMPLLGDQKYADEATKIYAEHLGIKNVALCAFEIAFNQPKTGERLLFSTRPMGEAFKMFIWEKQEDKKNQGDKEHEN